MERKIGEIFEFGGEWYQCLKSASCDECAFSNSNCIDNPSFKCSVDDRTDNCSVIFKKLEKVGKPITVKDRIFQCLNAFKTECTGCVFLNHKRGCDKCNYTDDPCPDSEIWVEIKQTKEDMEEKKQKLDDLVGLYTSAKITYKEFDEKLKTLYADKEECKSSLKEFDLEAAKAGKPVCTRDGRKVRIICFDAKRKDKKKIIALVPSKDYPGFEDLIAYPNNGNYYGGHENDGDLMMLPERKEGWVNVYNDTPIYDTKERAELGALTVRKRIATVKISWEE